MPQLVDFKRAIFATQSKEILTRSGHCGPAQFCVVQRAWINIIKSKVFSGIMLNIISQVINYSQKIETNSTGLLKPFKLTNNKMQKKL